ncbi:class I SAM-dependent methyltransferase [Candidatus Omnitrophota bacterium]
MDFKKRQSLIKEENFHDAWADSINIDEIMVDESFEACTAPENRLVIKRLGGLKGKKVLDLGCGAGEASVYFAKKGADVTAADNSDGMLRVVQQVAKKFGVSLTVQKSCSHEIGCKDGTFDIVYAANLLHHVDIERTLAEVRRVLKKGGVFVSWDPLAYNPLIRAYRRIAKEVRTQDEHPITMRDLEIFKRYFSRVEVETTWLLTLWVFVKLYLFDRIDPNKIRYWKLVLSKHKKLETIYRPLEKIDTVILRFFPFLKRYCWNVVIFSSK